MHDYRKAAAAHRFANRVVFCNMMSKLRETA